MRKSQFGVIGVLMAVIAAILLFALMPVITQTISSVSGSVDSDTALLMNLLPAALVLAIILGLFGYVRLRSSPPPQYPPGYG